MEDILNALGNILKEYSDEEIQEALLKMRTKYNPQTNTEKMDNGRDEIYEN